jgi:eukaryotic-like serine/threonine-protein kinase
MEHPARVGKYAIEKFLGGSMSNVYRAKDTVLGRQVAIKILTKEGAADEESKQRFLQEARMASNIIHENIISVYDFGEDQGLPFIVMEYLEGESLRAAIRANRCGDFARRMKIALQIARAVDYIHSKKVIHRDIKPENINIDPAGKIKMMDFGIAKADGMQLTRAGFTLGTPYYMAPEQVLGKALTPQADVYAFGVLLFELLTGERALSGDRVEAIFESILNEPLDISPLHAQNVPPEVVGLIERCTAKQPSQRPPGLCAVADEIELIVRGAHGRGEGRQVVAGPSPPIAPQEKPDDSRVLRPGPLPESGDEGPPAWLEKLPPRLQTQGGLMVLAAAAMVMLFAVFGLIYVALRMAHVTR